MKKSRFIRARVNYYSKDKDGTYTKKSFYKNCVKESVKSYFNWHHLLAKLSPTTLSVLFYLAEKMDEENNEISHNKTIIRSYQEFRQSIGLKKCSDSAVKSAYQDLKKTNIFIQTPERGNYVVNPIYLFKGSEESRRHCINTLLEHTKHTHWDKTNLQDALNIVVVKKPKLSTKNL